MLEQEGNVQTSSEATTATTEVQTSIDWRSSLSEDLRSNPSIKDFKGVDDLAKSYTELVKYQGNSIRIPGEDASPEARDKFFEKLQGIEGIVRIDEKNLDSVYDRLGRPESPDKYQMPEIEGMQYDQEALKEFKELAHKSGLNINQTKEIMSYYANEVLHQAEAHNQRVEEVSNQLKKEWGDDYNNRLHGVKEAVKMYADGMDERQLAELEADLSKHPTILKALSDYYSTLKEKGTLKGSASVQYGLTPQEAAEKIAEIRSNRELMNIYYNPTHPDNKAIKAKLEALYAIKVNKG